MAAAIGTITVPVAVKVNGEWQEVGEVTIPLTVANQRPGALRTADTKDTIRDWDGVPAVRVKH